MLLTFYLAFKFNSFMTDFPIKTIPLVFSGNYIKEMNMLHHKTN